MSVAILLSQSNSALRLDPDRPFNLLLTPVYASTSEFSFAASGDWGCTPKTIKTINGIIEKDPEIVLGLGDFSYRQSVDCWYNLISPISSKMKITLGNHDAISLKKLLQLSDLFELKHPYYSFDHKGVHFVTISTEFAMERGSEQFRFMEKDLRNASSDPKTNWIVVFIHKPTYSSPAAHKGLEILQKLYHGLFQKYNVDLVLQGHNHFYERTYPVIVNTLNYSNPIPTSHVKNSYTNQTGQIFVTVGTGGESLYKYHGEPPFIAAQYEGYGFLNVDVINDTKTTTMEAKFYGDDGNIKDEFSIEKTLGKKIGG